MTLNFAEFTQKMRAGATPTEQDLLDIITAGPGATFALVEFAAEYRRTYFRNTVEVVNLLDASGSLPETGEPVGAVVNVGDGESAEQLAASLAKAGGNDAAGRVIVNFLVPTTEQDAPGAADLTPMQCLRVLAAARLAAPAKSLRVGEGRRVHLRSLQSLAMHVIDSIYLSDYRDSEAAAVFEDLKLIQGAGLQVIGAEQRDLAADYVSYLRGEGVEDAQAYADTILGDDEPDAASGGGCGGNCACGSGGCGA